MAHTLKNGIRGKSRNCNNGFESRCSYAPKGTRFISRNIYSPKIFLRVIVEVFNEILEEKTTNEIKQTDLLVEKSAEIYCSNLFRPKRSSTKINHRNVRWIFHRKKQRIFWPINYSSKVSYITWTLPTRHFIIMEMSLSKKTAQSIKTQVTNNTLYRSLSLSLSPAGGSLGASCPGPFKRDSTTH